MIRRADDLLKYSPNRDASTAHAQARAQLERANASAAQLEDRGAAQALEEQVRRRLEDLERLERED